MHALIRPAFQVLRLNVQAAVLSEAEARPKDLKLLLDERSLDFVQRLALSSRGFSERIVNIVFPRMDTIKGDVDWRRQAAPGAC